MRARAASLHALWAARLDGRGGGGDGGGQRRPAAHQTSVALHTAVGVLDAELDKVERRQSAILSRGEAH